MTDKIKYGISLLDHPLLVKLNKFNKETINLAKIYSIYLRKNPEEQIPKSFSKETTNNLLTKQFELSKDDILSGLTSSNIKLTDFKILKKLDDPSKNFKDIQDKDLYAPLKYFFNLHHMTKDGFAEIFGKKLPDNYLIQYLKTNFITYQDIYNYIDFTDIHDFIFVDSSNPSVPLTEIPTSHVAGCTNIEHDKDIQLFTSNPHYDTSYGSTLLSMKLNNYTGQIIFNTSSDWSTYIYFDISVNSTNQDIKFYDQNGQIGGTIQIPIIDNYCQCNIKIGNGVRVNDSPFDGAASYKVFELVTRTASGNSYLFEYYNIKDSIEPSYLTCKRLNSNWSNIKPTDTGYYFVRIFSEEPAEELLYLNYHTTTGQGSSEIISFNPIYIEQEIEVLETTDNYQVKFPNYYPMLTTIYGDINSVTPLKLIIDKDGTVYINHISFYEISEALNKSVVYYYPAEIPVFQQNYIDTYTNKIYKYQYIQNKTCSIQGDNIIQIPHGKIKIKYQNGSYSDTTLPYIKIKVNGQVLNNNKITFIDEYNGYIVFDHTFNKNDNIEASYFTYNEYIQIKTLNLIDQIKLNERNILIGLKPTVNYQDIYYPSDSYPGYKLFWTTPQLYSENKGYLAFGVSTNVNDIISESKIIAEISLDYSIILNDYRIRGGVRQNPKDIDPLMIKMWDFGHWDGINIPNNNIIFIKITEEEMRTLISLYKTTNLGIFNYLDDYYSSFLPATTKIIYVDEEGNRYV